MNNEQEQQALNNEVQIKRKRYDKDFIHQVLGVYRSGFYTSVVECAKAYCISEKTLHGWIYKYEKIMPPEVISEQQAEIARLKKELSRVKMENEILKKASIYFANQAR